MSPLTRRIYKTLVFSRFYKENTEIHQVTFESPAILWSCLGPMLFLLAERIVLLEKKEETLNLEIRLKTNIGNIFTTWNIFGEILSFLSWREFIKFFLPPFLPSYSFRHSIDSKKQQKFPEKGTPRPPLTRQCEAVWDWDIQLSSVLPPPPLSGYEWSDHR